MNISFADGRKLKSAPTAILSTANINQQKFFDDDNQVIKEVNDGEILLPRSFVAENKIKLNDELIIKSLNGCEIKVKYVGNVKDAILGSDMMGTHRYLLSDNDYKKLYEESDLPKGYLYSITTDDPKGCKSEMEEYGIKYLFADGRELIKLSYVMDMVIAAIILAVSICLIIIAIIMLKFIISFTVNEDFTEIGIMKAIGINNMGIRSLYAVKYFAIAIAGSILGFIGSIPFGKILLKKVSMNMVLSAEKGSVLVQFFLCVLVAIIITLSAYHTTGKIKKYTPMDAIRRGNNGERFRKKGFLKLEKSHLATTGFMAANDVLAEFKKYIALLVTSIVGMWLVIMPVNSINTLRSDKITCWFGMLQCDAFLEDDAGMVDIILAHDKSRIVDYLAGVDKKLEENGIETENVFVEALFKINIRKDDKSAGTFASQGIGTKATDYMCDEGEMPKYANEIALGYKTRDYIDAEIGDTIYITFGDEERAFVVTGIFQTMNNLGEGCRFHEDAEVDYSYCTGTFGVQINFGDNGGKSNKELIREVKKIYPDIPVDKTGEYVDKMIGNISERLKTLKYFILAIVITIAVLVVVLMQKMFLIREKGEMGMLKSIGFTNSSIIEWQTKRIVFIIAIGIFIGTATSYMFTKLTAEPVFRIMGAKTMVFEINKLEVYVIFPIVVFIATIIASILTMQKVRKINVQDMNNLE